MITTSAPAFRAAAIRSEGAPAPVTTSVGTSGSVNSGSEKSRSIEPVTTATAAAGPCPAAARRAANASRARAGRYPSRRTVSAPAITTSARPLRVPKIRMSAAQEMPCERPSCWAAPSRVETMLARSQGVPAPSARTSRG